MRVSVDLSAPLFLLVSVLLLVSLPQRADLPGKPGGTWMSQTMTELDTATLERPQSAASETSRHADMVLIPGGTFRMGSDHHYAEEAPVHRVTVGAFWIDHAPVTNREFRNFARATGYVTFAEIAPD